MYFTIKMSEKYKLLKMYVNRTYIFDLNFSNKMILYIKNIFYQSNYFYE